MTQLNEWILNELQLSDSKIKKIIAIYPGRFQPMGAHHAKTYKWLEKQFGANNTYVATSDKVQLPKSPFNFNEKKKIINSHGITNVVRVKTPYIAEEILSKYDPETTAVVFMYGAKDAGRLRTTKKDGSPGYYQSYKKNKNNLKGYKEHGYFVIAPHVSMSVPGFGEMSGTEIRKALGSDTPNKEKIFKGIFGHTKKNIYDLIVGKLEGVKETINRFVTENPINELLSEGSNTIRLTGSEVDDGPRYFYGHRQAYETLTKDMAERLGYEVVDWILDDTKTMDFRNPYPKGPVQSVSYFPSGVAGKTTPTNQQDYKGTKAYKEWQKHIKRVAGILGMKFVNWLSADDSKDKKIKEPNKVEKNPNIAESVLLEASPLDKVLTWNDEETGEKKSGTARSVIRTGNPKHPAWDDAERLKQQDDDKKETDTEKQKTRDKAEREKEKEKTAKEKEAPQDKPKGTPLTATDFQLPQEKDVEFTPDGDTPKDTKFTAHKDLLNKAKKSLKKLSDSEKQLFRDVPEKKRSVGEAILNKVKSIPKALTKTFKHKVHVYKDAGKAFGKLALGDPLHKEDKSALKQLAIDAAILSGMVASAGTGTGAAAFGKVVAQQMATMWVKDISILGVGRAALFAGTENKTDDEMMQDALKHFGTWLQTKKLTEDDYLQMLANYQPETNEAFMPNPHNDPRWVNGGKLVKPKKAPGKENRYDKHMNEKFSKEYWKNVFEGIDLPVEVGDTVYMGKFKNKPVKVTDISWNEKGDLLINGKSALRMRIPKKPNVYEASHIREAKKKLPKFKNIPSWARYVAQQSDGEWTWYEETPTMIKFRDGSGGAWKQDGNQTYTGVKTNGKDWDKIPTYYNVKNGKVFEASLSPSATGVNGYSAYATVNNIDSRKNLFTKTSGWALNENLLLEGGAYGHMNHPFDDANLKFADLKRMIDLGLQGKLDVEQSVTEKTDGQNLMVTWKDGKLKAARNKSTLIDPMDINAVKSKFAGRGDIEKAFVYAMKDLEKAIGKISDKQKDKIFKGGRAFMNLEIIYPATENVIVYDTAVIQFHGAIEYDDKGNIVGPVKDSGKMLQGMISQVNADTQKHFKIIKPQVLNIKPHNDYTKKRDYFFNKLKKLQKEFNLKDQDTLGLYHQMWWESFIRRQANKTNYIVPNNVMEGLIRRWAFFEKKYTAREMKRDIKDSKFLEWALSFEKTEHTSQVKDNMYPFETLVFELGTEILHNVENYLTASPDKAMQKIKDEVGKVASEIERGGDIKKIERLRKQLARIEAAGGLDKVVPSEGLVFWYGGKQWKITGQFGPINAILGTLKFAK